ncbi:MAG: hypothetical protein LBU68_02105, partial [Rickettsiales bacterium]|nr:hypothetical protein [Rickettsiales bacterium]
MRTNDELKNSESEHISDFVSFRGFIWKLKSINNEAIQAISEKHKLSYVMSKIIGSRDISINNVDNFINPKLKNLMPDPFLLSDMDKAANRIIAAIENSEHIGIFGDYDVDGATSSSLIYKFLTMIGHDENKITIHIPDRIDEGY